jgi:hypothetical protein
VRGGYGTVSFLTVSSPATVSELQAQGASVTVDDGATLTLSSTSTASGVGVLTLGYDSGTGSLSTAAGLSVLGGLYWINGTMSGGGTVTLEQGSTSQIVPTEDSSSDAITLNGVTVVNKGALYAECDVDNDTTNSMTLISGENGSTLDNRGYMEFDNPGAGGPSYGCEFKQGGGDASTFENDAQIYWSGDDSVDSIAVGWVFDNSDVNSVINNAIVDLYGGQGAPVGGHWNGASLNLMSGGAYSITSDLADFGSQDESQADLWVAPAPGSWAATTAYTSFLAGTTEESSLAITAGEWQNGWITVDGPLTLGQAGQVTTVSNIWNDSGQSITVNGTVNAYSYNADDSTLDVASDSDFNVYGTTGLSGTETVSGGSGSTVDFEGPINVADTSSITTSGGLVLGGAVTGTGDLSVSVGGSFWEQGGITTTGALSVTSTGSSDVQLSGPVDTTGDVTVSTAGNVDIYGDVDAANLSVDANNITVEGQLGGYGGDGPPPLDSLSLTAAGNMFLAGQISEDGTFTLTGGGVATLDSSWMYAPTLTVDGEVVENDGTIDIGSQLLAEDGSQIINDGSIYADGTTFEDSGSGPASELINTADGQLDSWGDPSTPDNTVSIPYTGTGSVSPAYDLEDILPSNLTPPTITGTTRVGQTLTASSGTWSGTGLTYSYQWVSCPAGSSTGCTDIPDATGTQYTLTPADVGSEVEVQVDAAASGSSGSVTVTGSPSSDEDVIVSPAAGPACTNAWTGDGPDASFTDADNWYGGAPGSGSVACITAGYGSYPWTYINGPVSIGALIAPSTTLIVNYGGSMALTGTSGTSTVGYVIAASRGPCRSRAACRCNGGWTGLRGRSRGAGR